MFSLSNTWEFRNSLFYLWFPPMVLPMICPGSHSWTELHFSWEQIISHVETGTVITNISVTGSSHVCVTQVGYCGGFSLFRNQFQRKDWLHLLLWKSVDASCTEKKDGARRVFRSAGLQADWAGRWPQRAAALGKPDISQPACIRICICICVCISQQAWADRTKNV